MFRRFSPCSHVVMAAEAGCAAPDTKGITMLGRVEYKYLVAILAVFAIFMELLDSTVVNVALPTLGRDFDVTSPTTIQWVITGYLLSLAVFIPVSGWAGDRFGTKRVFMFALSVFTFASLLSALAWNIEALIAFRVLQGVGGGMLSPVAFATVWRAFPPEERSKAAGIMVVPAAAAPASGPLVGGLILKYTTWHWIFLLNVPIGLAALVISALYLREHREPSSGRFDPAGFVLSATGLAMLMYALAEAGQRGFGDARVIGFGAAGLAFVAVFVAVELRTKQPMLDVRIFTNALFRSCNFAWLVTMFGFSSTVFLLTLELQAARGLSALESGLTTFPMAIGVMLVAQPASRIYRVIGPRRMIFAGLLITGLTALALSRVDLNTNEWLIRGLLIIRGLAFGLVLVPLQAATYARIDPKDTGRATALYNVTSQVASSFGVAFAATLLTSRLADYGAMLGAPATRGGEIAAFQDVFLLTAVMALAGAAVAFLVRDRDATATMRQDVAVGPPVVPVPAIEIGEAAE
ncbi:MAG: multidrug efflux MFS transporter [Chloroflexi bacterium]|nr:multidrug efflux MFS transporter [Chloroflexota bacterium]